MAPSLFLLAARAFEILVDKLLAALGDAGDPRSLRSRTVVARISDHGELGLSHGGLRQKMFNAYEETLRVPLVISNPLLFPHGAETGAQAALVAQRLKILRPQIGRFEVVYFTPQVTTTQDVGRWLRDMKRTKGFDPKLLIFDMGDHFVSKVNSDRPSYEDMRIVYDGMRSLAVEREGWAWTASHLKGGNVGKKKTDTTVSAALVAKF